jgi:hypothetical protein
VDKYSGGDEGKKPPEEAVALIAPTWLSDGQRRAVVAKLNHGLSASEAQELLDELDWAKRRLRPALRSPAALLAELRTQIQQMQHAIFPSPGLVRATILTTEALLTAIAAELAELRKGS